MIEIIDNRYNHPVLLKDIDEGECFIQDGKLFRKLNEGIEFGNVEYMYSGIRDHLDPHIIVDPVDVTIIMQMRRDVEDE